MNQLLELEFKFRADDIKLNDFNDLVESIGYVKKLEISSWDTYYVRSDNKDEFIRFRNSTTPELTLKRKTSQENNWKRLEIDLPLDPKRINEETVDAWAKIEGYEKKKSIFKTCFIYWTDTVNFVYYIVFDENMAEIGRFIEVESNKNNSLNELDSFEDLKKYEQELSKLGIVPQNRLKRSLFELYVRE